MRLTVSVKILYRIFSLDAWYVFRDEVIEVGVTFNPLRPTTPFLTAKLREFLNLSQSVEKADKIANSRR